MLCLNFLFFELNHDEKSNFECYKFMSKKVPTFMKEMNSEVYISLMRIT